MDKIIKLKSAQIRYWVAYAESERNKFESLTLEINMNKNTSSYGLLGIRILTNNSIMEEVPNTRIDSVGEKYSSEITTKSDIFIGLPEEYSENIKKSINQFAKLNNFAAKNKFIISCAAHSEVGSSSFVFGTLASIIMEVFFDNENLLLEEVISNNVMKSAFFKI